MKRYDPVVAPDPAAWLELDESEQIELVMAYHRRVRDRLPNVRAHASFHVIVENQLAMGLAEAVDALRRLQKEGLDRHDAIHAIASVLAEHMHQLLRGGGADDDANRRYAENLTRLTKKQWLSLDED